MMWKKVPNVRFEKGGYIYLLLCQLEFQSVSKVCFTYHYTVHLSILNPCVCGEKHIKRFHIKCTASSTFQSNVSVSAQ